MAFIEEKTEEGVNLISCTLLQFGDYDNSCAVERANVRYLDNEKLIEQKETECYGYVKAWILDTPENQALLDKLQDYPCFDDEIVSEIETEIEEEYIKDNDDIYRLHTPDENLKEALDLLDRRCIDPEAYYQAKEEANIYFKVQTGGTGYINLEKLAPDYNLILTEKYPEIKIIAELLEEKEERQRPEFPCWPYENAFDMLSQAKLDKKTLEDTEAFKQVLKYTSELEELID